MVNYYWIIAEHSGKVVEVEGGSFHHSAKIIQYNKKSEDDPGVGTQLWYFDGKFIVNKRSGLVLDVYEGQIQNGARIIQFPTHAVPAVNQEWDYDYENSTINLRSDRSFVLEVKDASKDDFAPIILQKKNDGQNQRFTLQKWNVTSNSENANILWWVAFFERM
ncbi:unnamed protein product [Rhizophagus irregularis]|nr:unnamed protein product [Rhizophagus irregularis]